MYKAHSNMLLNIAYIMYMYNIEINFQDINVDVKSKAIALEKTGPSFLKLKKILQINHTPRDDKGGPDGGAGFALLFITSTRLSFFLYFFLSFFLFLSLSLSLSFSSSLALSLYLTRYFSTKLI